VVDVHIANRGEDAYESEFFLHLPKGLNYNQMVASDQNAAGALLCSPPADAGDAVLRCEIGNPFVAGARVDFKVLLEAVPRVQDQQVNVTILCETNSTNAEEDGQLVDNSLPLTIDWLVDTGLSLSAQSRPQVIHRALY